VCGGSAPVCTTAYNHANCLNYIAGTRVSSGGHNWTCVDGNCANCDTFPACEPGAAGCPWGAVWRDDGTCS
jgi:hypothetical protein